MKFVKYSPRIETAPVIERFGNVEVAVVDVAVIESTVGLVEAVSVDVLTPFDIITPDPIGEIS